MPSRVRRASSASGTPIDPSASRAVQRLKGASPNAGPRQITAANAPPATTQPFSFFCQSVASRPLEAMASMS